MANKRPKPEEIVTKLRQVEVLMGQGMSASGCDQTDQRYRADILSLEEEVRWNGNGPIEGTQASAERE